MILKGAKNILFQTITSPIPHSFRTITFLFLWGWYEWSTLSITNRNHILNRYPWISFNYDKVSLNTWLFIGSDHFCRSAQGRPMTCLFLGHINGVLYGLRPPFGLYLLCFTVMMYRVFRLISGNHTTFPYRNVNVLYTSNSKVLSSLYSFYKVVFFLGGLLEAWLILIHYYW